MKRIIAVLFVIVLLLIGVFSDGYDTIFGVGTDTDEVTMIGDADMRRMLAHGNNVRIGFDNFKRRFSYYPGDIDAKVASTLGLQGGGNADGSISRDEMVWVLPHLAKAGFINNGIEDTYRIDLVKEGEGHKLAFGRIGQLNMMEGVVTYEFADENNLTVINDDSDVPCAPASAKTEPALSCLLVFEVK